MPSELDQVLKQVYEENPKWWPHGLRSSMLDRAYLVKDTASGKTSGFVGWQFRKDKDGGKVGYYVVGILPEFRRKGIAKKALKELLTDHLPADVQRVRAYIVEGNNPSMALARSLGVSVEHKCASLRLPPGQLSLPDKMARIIPKSYDGVALQQFMPLTSRREKFTPEEEEAIAEGKSQWFPRVFKSWADSPAADMLSPGRAALAIGLGSGGLAYAGLNAAGADPTTKTYGSVGAGALSALLTYLGSRAHNSNVEEQMRRIPPNGTRRDILSDPVLQAELDRESRTGSSEEALRTAQLLAVLQATKKAGEKRAVNWGQLAKSIGEHVGRNKGVYGTLGGVGGAVGWDAALYNGEYPKDQLPIRGAMALLNTALLGRGLYKGNPAKALIQIPTKDLAVSTGLNLPTFASAAKRYASGTDAAPVTNVQTTPSTSSFADAMNWMRDNKGLTALGAVGGAGLLAGGGMMALDALRDVGKSMHRDAGGRIKVTLPTKRPGDAETQLDIPVSDMPLSNALLSRLQRDMRVRLNTETKERTRKLNLSPEERARRAAVLAQFRMS